MFYILLKIIILPIIKLIWVGKVEGIENIPKKGGFILASNHESYFDFITLYAVVPRRIYFLAGEVFFQKKQWSWLMKLTKQIKVDRNSEDKSLSINEALKHLRMGHLIGIFPEGTRSSDGKLQKAYNGAVKMSLKASVPIIPIGIIGTLEIMSRHDRFPKFKKCVINFGKPIVYKKSDSYEEKYTNLTKDLMVKIGNLCGEIYNY